MPVRSFSPFVADRMRVLLCVVFFFGTARSTFSQMPPKRFGPKPGSNRPTP